MDFAKKQLEKYGWSEGKGLGKHEDGISVALKPKLKFDKSGVGHDYGKDFTEQWWADLYNKSANKIKVETSNDGTKSVTVPSCSEVSKKPSKKYDNFLKTAKLTTDGLVSYSDSEVPQRDLKKEFVTQQLTDEELFIACGGRTAHKGARHGLKLSGKLARIEKQEKILAKKLQKISFDTESAENGETVDKKMKKLHKFKSLSNTFDNSSAKKKKSKKKKHKSVSFSETVTEYHTQELDTSSQSNDSVERIEPAIVLKTKIKHAGESVPIDNSDEGIELDDEIKTPEAIDNEELVEMTITKKKKKSKKNKVRDGEKTVENILMKVCKRKKCKEDEAKLALEGTGKKRRQIIEDQVFNNISDCLDQVCRISESE